MKKLILCLLVLSSVFVIACGQKGNLYLPTPVTPSPVTPVSTPSK